MIFVAPCQSHMESSICRKAATGERRHSPDSAVPLSVIKQVKMFTFSAVAVASSVQVLSPVGLLQPTDPAPVTCRKSKLKDLLRRAESEGRLGEPLS